MTLKTGSLVVAVSVVLAASFTLNVSDAFATDQIIPRIPSSRSIQEKIVPHGFFKLPEPRRVEFKRPVNRHRRFPNAGFGSSTTFVGVIAPPVSYPYDNDPGNYGAMYDDPGPTYAAPPAYYNPPVYGADYAPPVNTVSLAPATAPNAERRRVSEWTVRAPWRWDDVAVQLGMDPESAATASSRSPPGGPMCLSDGSLGPSPMTGWLIARRSRHAASIAGRTIRA